jgi:hypothetical protein
MLNLGTNSGKEFHPTFSAPASPSAKDLRNRSTELRVEKHKI